MLRYMILLCVVLCIVTICLLFNRQEKWAAYYGHDVPYAELEDFNVLVFDSDNHPPLAPLKAARKTVLGYISLGEADPARDYYSVLAQEDLLLSGDPASNGQTVIDVRNPKWGDYVIRVLVPKIMAQGFDGIMIDTVDSIIQTEVSAPRRYAGMQKAAARIIKDIRMHYPNLKIMVNRGFAILPMVAGDIDMVLAESTYSTVSPDTKQHMLRPQEEYKNIVRLLNNVKRQSASLKIYTLDYWPQEDGENVKRIYAAQRGEGFIPYVSTQDLQSLYHEP